MSMAAQPIGWRYFGDSALHSPTREVTRDDLPYVTGILAPALARIHSTAWSSGVGIAAPQIGSDLRVSLAYLAVDPKEQGGQREARLLINPCIVERSEQTETHVGEGCLSIPHFRTSVKRPSWVVVDWHDAEWERHREKFRGFDAQIIQHEIDHLDGKTIACGLPRQQRRAAARAVTAHIAQINARSTPAGRSPSSEDKNDG